MTKFLSIFLLLISTLSFGASGSGNVSNVLQLGGTKNLTAGQMTVPISGLSGQKMLMGGTSSLTLANGNFYPLYSGDTQYVVPSGKHFYVSGFCLLANSTGGAYPIQFGYASATFSNNTLSASPPTGAKYYGSSSSYNDGLYVSIAGSAWECWPIGGFSFPRPEDAASNGSNTYPFFRGAVGSGGTVEIMQVWGVEL